MVHLGENTLLIFRMDVVTPEIPVLDKFRGFVPHQSGNIFAHIGDNMVRGPEAVNHGRAMSDQFLQPGSRLLQLHGCFGHFHGQRIFALLQEPLGLFAGRDIPAHPDDRLRLRRPHP